MRQNQEVFSGNIIQVEFDGKLLGLVQSVRQSDSYGLEDASGIGDIHVKEHVPSKAVHSLSVSQMVLKKKNMRAAGITPQNGDDVLKGLVFDIVFYSRNPDGTPGDLLAKYIGCSYDSGDLDVSAHRIVMASAQFKALDRVGTPI